MINNSSSKCKNCMVLIRILTAESILRNSRIFAKHVGTKNNGKGDALSRLDMSRFLGGLSLHLNHLIASGMTIYDWPFGTLPFRLFGSNLDTRDLETYPRTYSGHF